MVAASILAEVSLEAATVGWTSWSRTQRAMVDNLLPLRLGTEHVVEMVGDLGPPALQHEAARSTQKLATLLGAEPVFLRTPAVVPSRAVADALLDQDTYARHALNQLDKLDIALLSIGACTIEEPLQAGHNMFTKRQIDDVRKAGAVGEVCLRYIDADGLPLASPLDEVTIGVTTQQLRHARRRWAIAGGERKREAVRSALRGRWVDVPHHGRRDRTIPRLRQFGDPDQGSEVRLGAGFQVSQSGHAGRGLPIWLTARRHLRAPSATRAPARPA